MIAKSITLLGLPLDLGARNLGVADGPAAFRQQDIVGKLRQAGLQVTDSGDVTVAERAGLPVGNPRLKYLDEIVRVNQELATRTAQAVTSGQRVVVLGGDHSLNLGAFTGAAAGSAGPTGLVYFDAHGDMNTDATTLSGNIHGMHLASLLGHGAPELVNLHTPGAKLAASDLLHIGGSDWDQAELDLIKRENLQAYSLFDILTRGLGPLITYIDELAARLPNIWISLDLDCIDRMYAPGAGMPNPKGLAYREVALLAKYIGQHCNVIGVDVVEYNPAQDEAAKTAELAIELIAKFLGTDYSWYSNYIERNQLGS